MSTTKVTYGITTPLSPNAFVRPGHQFQYWHVFRVSDQTWLYTDVNGNPKWLDSDSEDAVGLSLRMYNDNTSVSQSTEVYNDTIILYAQWKQNVLTVKYYSNFATHYDGTEPLPDGTIISAESNAFLGSKSYAYAKEYSSGLDNYNYGSGATRGMSRFGYINARKWGTSTDGGRMVSDTKSFASGQALAESLGKDLTNGNAEVDVYAQWTPETYIVKYDANESNYSAPAAQTKTYGVDLILHKDEPELSDSLEYPTRTLHVFYENIGSNTGISSEVLDMGEYDFSHWNTATDGTGKSYAPGDIYSENSAVTLYAIWTEKFSDTVTVELSTWVPERIGYTFLGWYDSLEGDTKVGDPGAEIAVSEDLTVYAHWEAKTFTIKYDLNGATLFNGKSEIDYTYGYIVYISTQKPIHPGYNFRGWQGSYSTKLYAPGDLYESPGCNETLVAIYEKITDTIDTIDTGAYIRDVDAQDHGLDWAVSFNRKSSAPLDRSSLFNSKDDAEEYAKGTNEDSRHIGSTSYVGQILSVYEKTDTYETVSVYVILPDKKLAELFTSDKYYTIDGETAAAADPESFTDKDLI